MKLPYGENNPYKKWMFKSILSNVKKILFTFTTYFEMINFNFEILCSYKCSRYLSIHYGD